MTRETCPNCGAHLREGGFSSDVNQEGLRENAVCQECGTEVLRSMNEEDASGRRDWRPDNEESGRARRVRRLSDRLSVDLVHDDGTVELHLRGECDASNAEELARQIQRAGEPAERVVIDLAELEFIDTAGLKLLIAATEAARVNGQVLRLRGGNETLMRIFEMAGLDKALPFE